MTGEWRITDGDRHCAVQALGEHYAAGRLDRAEFDERSERALAAKTNEDVRPLFVDLPAPHGPLEPAAAPARGFAPDDGREYRRQYRRRGLFPLPLVPLVLLFLVLVVGLHFFWLFPLLFIGFWVVRGHRHGHGHRGW